MNGVLGRVHCPDRVTLGFLRISGCSRWRIRCTLRVWDPGGPLRGGDASQTPDSRLPRAHHPGAARRVGDHRRPGGRAGEVRRHRHRHPGAHRSRSDGLRDRARADRVAAARRAQRTSDSRDAQERPRRRRSGGARRCRVQLGVDRVNAGDRAVDGDRRSRSRSAEHAAHRRFLLRSARRRLRAVLRPDVPLSRACRRCASIRRVASRSAEPRALCYAQISTQHASRISAPFVTECPAVMQPNRR